MYQRLDKLNKNSFACMCVFGKSRDAQIQGLWIWRGKDLVFPLSDNWQVIVVTFPVCATLTSSNVGGRV